MRNHRQEEKQRAERKAMLLFGGVLLAVALILVVSSFVKGPELEAETHCPKNLEAQNDRASILVVDLTDKLPELRAASTLTIAKNIAKTLRRHELFSVFVLRPETGAADIHPIFSQCNPGEPTLGDYFNKGRRELREEFESTFVASLEAKLKEQIRREKYSRDSPIIESLRDIAHSQYWGKNNRLYLISDLIENSRIASLYEGNKTFATVVRSPAGRIFDTIDLTNTEVGVCPTEYSVAKLSPLVQANAVQFWKELFTHSKASCVQFGCQITGATCQR